MAFVDLTKQLAQQAIQSAMSDPAPAGPSPDNPGAVMLNQIGAMQKALKDDEELFIHLQNGEDKIRVMEIFLPSPLVAVLTGIDGNHPAGLGGRFDQPDVVIGKCAHRAHVQRR